MSLQLNSYIDSLFFKVFRNIVIKCIIFHYTRLYKKYRIFSTLDISTIENYYYKEYVDEIIMSPFKSYQLYFDYGIIETQLKTFNGELPSNGSLRKLNYYCSAHFNLIPQKIPDSVEEIIMPYVRNKEYKSILNNINLIKLPQSITKLTITTADYGKCFPSNFFKNSIKILNITNTYKATKANYNSINLYNSFKIKKKMFEKNSNCHTIYITAEAKRPMSFNILKGSFPKSLTCLKLDVRIKNLNSNTFDGLVNLTDIEFMHIAIPLTFPNYSLPTNLKRLTIGTENFSFAPNQYHLFSKHTLPPNLEYFKSSSRFQQDPIYYPFIIPPSITEVDLANYNYTLYNSNGILIKNKGPKKVYK